VVENKVPVYITKFLTGRSYVFLFFVIGFQVATRRQNSVLGSVGPAGRGSYCYLRVEGLTAVKMSIVLMWVVTPCGLVGYHRSLGWCTGV
jgi:hypothetical protein